MNKKSQVHNYLIPGAFNLPENGWVQKGQNCGSSFKVDLQQINYTFNYGIDMAHAIHRMKEFDYILLEYLEFISTVWAL